MAAYADFAFYSGTFFGTAVDEATFNRLAVRASALIDQLTFDRALPVTVANTETALVDKIKMAVCSVVEQMYLVETTGSDRGSIQSESVGSHHVTYVSGGGPSDFQNQYDIISAYLATSGLMYRGF